MEGEALFKKNGVMLMIMIMVLITCDDSIKVDCAFGIDINPCTLPTCIAACQNILNEKYQSATCATGPKEKYCICLG
ncbi:hypothetical protein EJD97_009789 [Solanum chilense]|uniref:Bifunctional inhibitor/plant lipid transfer protein/seed storage helical domain-containing protein n=1 Tax=Solanum chilense TaxID=4083 RepID=A0A6N2BP76_SOLCI|nr:hypothetical protein EJD97_009789 [Solanum chilense]